MIDEAIEKWTSSLTLSQVQRSMEEASVPAGAIYDAKDIVEDPHYNARGMFEEVTVNNRPLKLPAIVPKLTETPGETCSGGPELGEHNEEVFKGLLGLTSEEYKRLVDIRAVGASSNNSKIR